MLGRRQGWGYNSVAIAVAVVVEVVAGVLVVFLS